jgi:hypothetical protein
VVARVIANISSDTLTAFVREAVSNKVSLLCTDQWAGYKRLDGEYPHGVIDHSKGQYVIGAIHTQTIEGFCIAGEHGVDAFAQQRFVEAFLLLEQNYVDNSTQRRTG